MINFIRAKYLLPISEKSGRNKRIQDGYLIYQDNKIIEVGAYTDKTGNQILNKYEQVKVIGSDKKYAQSTSDFVRLEGVLLPGFVKAHGHDHESPIIGLVKDVSLTGWLDGAVNPFTKFIDEEEEKIKSVLKKSPCLMTYLKARIDDIYYGITSCMVHHCGYNKYHVTEIFNANEQAGTRMIVAAGSQDRNFYEKVLDQSPEVVTNRLDNYVKELGHAKRTNVIPGPDQFFSNGPELLKALKKWANDHNTFIHCHSSEEYKTTQWFKQQYGMTPVEYAHSIGFLDENTILAHQVHCTDNDLEILQKTSTKVVHNPLANTILGSGMPPIPRMLDMGIKVAISTDGSGSADNQNILSAARLASQYQKAIFNDPTKLPAQKVLEMITIEPAQILKLNSGSIEPGKDADFNLIDLRRPNLTPSSIHNIVENLIWASDGSEVQYVVSNGKILKDNYKIVALNAQEILSNVAQLTEMFHEYKEKLGDIKGTGANV